MVEESSESQDTQDERAYVLELFAKATRAEHAISRSEFMRGLSDCSPEIVIEAARETVQGDQFDQHTTALEAITYISKESEHYRDGILLLLEVLKSNDPVITLESLKLLTRLKVEGLSDPFIQLAQHDSRRVRKAVSFALAGQKTTKAARALIELSQDPTNEVRLWALHHCHHLASHGSPELKALASERLAMEEPGGGSPTAPIVLLARRSDPDVPAELKRLLKNNYLTEDTLKAALELKDPALFEYLWEASWHWQGDPELMASTLEFCRWDDPRETDELIELALTSKNYLAAEQAIALLQRRDTQEVFDSAVLLTEREESEERHLGARLLGRLGGPHGQFRQRAIPSLIGLLEDRNETIVAEAVRAIGESSSDTVDETIKQLENHPHGEVRRLVSVVLYGIENKGSSQALVALSTAREGIVRLAASQALVRILSPRNERPVGRAPARGEDQYADYVGSADHDEEAASSRAKRPRREPGRTRPPSRAAAQPQSKQVNKGLKGLSQQKQKLTAIIGVVSSLLSLAAFAMISSVMQSQGVDDYKDKAPDPEDGPIYEASADDLIDTKKRSGMFGARRAMQVASMLSRPPSDVLTNKSDTWYLYFRMDIRDATAIVARAETPESEKEPEWEHLDILVSIIADENNGDQTDKAGKFIAGLAARNGPLATHLIERVLDDTRFYQSDAFIMGMATISDSFKRKLLKQGIHTDYHPALHMISPSTRERMISVLTGGFAFPSEHRLAEHLRQLNRATTLE